MFILIILLATSLNISATTTYQFDIIQYHKDAKKEVDVFTNDFLYKSCSRLEEVNFDYDLLSNSDKTMATFCQGMILGIADLALLEGKFCPDMNLTTKQVLRFYTFYLQEHAVALNSSASKTILDALIDAWPCKKVDLVSKVSEIINLKKQIVKS